MELTSEAWPQIMIDTSNYAERNSRYGDKCGRFGGALGIGGCSFLETGQGSGDVKQRSGEVRA